MSVSLSGFERSHALVPQIMMVPNFRDRSITSGTVVERLFPGTFGPSLTMSPEPLEKELAVQVEYDMDEQGTPVNECSRGSH